MRYRKPQRPNELSALPHDRFLGSHPVKTELEADLRWAEFLRYCTSSLFQLQQSRGAFLTPPGPRSLERYMNVDRHTEWACRMRDLLDVPDKALVAELLALDEEEASSFLEEKLGWLRDFRE